MPQPLNPLSLVHLVCLSMWAGLVATESVIELAPFRKRELHGSAVEFHYWIDLLVEGPLLAAVVASGVALALTTDLTALHAVKIALGGTAIAVNVWCLGVVIRRRRLMTAGAPESELWRRSRRVLLAFAVGLPAGVCAAVLGFTLAAARMRGI
jgi:hypothetical protein